MKKQLLFLSLAAAALLVGCSKNESDTPANILATEISAKAISSVSIDTKAPVDGTSLNGLQADVYALTTKLSEELTPAAMFTEAYGRGTMTFDAAQYVGFDKGSVAGKDGGKSLLPQNPATPVYLYGFYPKGWTIGASAAGATVEALSMAFDGSKDLMSSYLATADDVKIQYNAAPIADKGELVFKHLLTRYNVQIKGESTDAITAWGAVKSINIKNAAAAKNVVEFQKTDIVKYAKVGGKDAPTFFKLTGTPAAPTYSDTKFAAADFATSQTLTDAFANACYTMLAPVTVDADITTPEITLEVVTLDKVGGKEKKTEVKVSLDQSKFGNAPFSTRGYSVTITLNFRAGAIQALASVEKWKDGGQVDEDVDGTTPAIEIGDLKDGGVVYEINGANYKVISLGVSAPISWSAQKTYVIGSGAQSDTDGKANHAAIKAHFTSNPGGIIAESTFEAAFLAAGFCEAKNTGGVTGWYLPAKEEMTTFYNVYQSNPSFWDKIFTDNGGLALGNGTFWTSTEDSTITSNVWVMGFGVGAQLSTGKDVTASFRCVRAN